MSLSENTPAPSEPKQGHRRNLVSIHFLSTGEHEQRSDVVRQLKSFFARAANVAERDGLLKTIDRFLLGEGLGDEVTKAALTRKQRKKTRSLGFEIRHIARLG